MPVDPKIFHVNPDSIGFVQTFTDRQLALQGQPVRETEYQRVRRICLARFLARHAASVPPRLYPASKPWQGYWGLAKSAKPQGGTRAEIDAENAVEARKCTISPPEKLPARPPDVKLPPLDSPRPKCLCESSAAGRALHRWRTQLLDQPCLLVEEKIGDQIVTVPIDPGPPQFEVTFEETCRALSDVDRCEAPIHFPSSVDEAAIGLNSVTARGMGGRVIDWLDTGKLAEDGTVKARWVGKEVGHGPFEAMEHRNWDWTQYVALRSTHIAVHEGVDTEHGYRANPRWVASEDRMEREYAVGERRADLTEPAGPDNVLYDDEGHVVLSLTSYEYFRRAVEARKGRLDPAGYWNGLACGTYLPRGTWLWLFDRHVVKERMEREKRKIRRLVRSLGFDPREQRMQQRIEALIAEEGREGTIKYLYRLHNERGVEIPR